jgi:hypothetical protein
LPQQSITRTSENFLNFRGRSNFRKGPIYALRPIITVRPKKSLKAAGQSIFLSKHPLHVDQLYGVFDTKKNGEII